MVSGSREQVQKLRADADETRTLRFPSGYIELHTKDELQHGLERAVDRLFAAEAVIRAAPCAHEHRAYAQSGYEAKLDCAEADCEQYCGRCAWLRDA